VPEADADLFGETILRGRLLPCLSVGLLRDPAQKSLEVLVVGGEVGGPIQRVEYGRVQLRLCLRVRLDQRPFQTVGETVVSFQDAMQLVDDRNRFVHGLSSG